MNVQLAGSGAERWAAWLTAEGHNATILSAADRAEPGHLVLVGGADVAACTAASARGALVIAADVTDDLAIPLARGGARYRWRAGATPAWLRAELAALANAVADPIHADSRDHYESSLRLHALLSHSATIIASLDRDGVFTFVAGEALARLGFKPEMLLGQNALGLFASLTMMLDGQPMSVGELFARVSLGDSLFVTTEVGGRKLDVRYGPLHRDGRIDGVMAVVHDLTERHLVEARARDAEEQLRTVVQNTPMILLSFDTAGIITFADGSSLREVTAPSRIVGVPVDALYSMWRQAPEVTTADGSTPPRGSLVAAALAGQSSTGHVRFEGRRFDYNTVPLYRDGQVIGGICVAYDRTEHYRAEEAVRVADESLRAFMEASPEPVGILRDRKFVAVNRPLAQALGYEPAELLGRDTLDLVVADERDESQRVMARVQGGETVRGLDWRLRRKDGTVATLQYCAVNIVFDGAPGVVLIGSDVSEQRLMQHKLMLAERMASMGTMAAGVAHEINNPLAYVMANLTFVTETLSEPAAPVPAALRTQLLDALADARDGAERVRKIVRDLKLFSRVDEQARAAVDVNGVLESAINMAYNEIRHRAQLIKDLAPLPPVSASDSRLCQVFVNLLINAAQAIPDGDAARQRIRVVSDVDGAGRVRVRVSDTGVGIGPAELARIFDPFFTTKPIGVGTGLGLSISHQIVKELGGEISVESQPGQGTTVCVVIPAATATASPSAPTPPAPAARRARVLVIDDEPAVLKSLRRALGREHELTTIGRAADALTLLRAGNVFDAVLCDVMMPDMNGCQLYREISSLRPELQARFAFLTGGVFADQADGELVALGLPVFDKPFDTAALRSFIAERGGGA